jgi:uncharacterized protein (DUF1697 family)
MPQLIRYAAVLRGVSPTNARMPELQQAFREAGFEEVTTFLSSGNVAFSAKSTAPASLERRAEAAMTRHLGHGFLTIVRPVSALSALLATDPYRGSRVRPEAKRIITFLRRAPTPAPRLPIEQDGARIVALIGTEAYSAYLPTPKGPVFMTLLQRTFGKEQTTRTWQTVARLVAREPT